MGRISGVRVGSSIGGKSKGGRKNKDVVQSSSGEGSRFWKKLRTFLGCMFWSSKGEDSSINKINQVDHGRHVTNDVDRQQPIVPRSSSNRRISSHARLSVPDQELFEASLLLRRFAFQDLMLATRTFKVENFHDEKGFGVLLKGWINPYGNYAARPGKGIPIAVKALNLNECQDKNEWLDEIIYLSKLQHLNLVRLVGFCLEDDKRLLVYEHICEGSLEKHLFKSAVHLTWPTRMKIAIGAANGMSFLHEEASRPLIFGDFKTSSILLDKDYNTKLCDFGLAKDASMGHEMRTTKMVGSKGYEAPEYIMTGLLTPKSNVYSFGLVLLELLTGRRVIDKTMPIEEQNLIEWLGPRLGNKANFHYLMDPRLEGQYPTKFAHKTMKLAIHCLRLDPKTRPLMSEVLHELKSLHDDMLGSSTSHGRRHKGPSNHVSPNKYGVGICPSSNFPRCFQAMPECQDYPLPLPPSPSNPRVRSSSNPSLEIYST
ncbi:probable serine/threonine-protein kinase PBL11 [Vigna angularis]|nr:probable serine/threonine-protein kinase PBL11 [Vigna angularis]